MSTIRFNYILVLLLLGTTWFYAQVYYEPVSQTFSTSEFVKRIENFPKKIGDWQYQGEVTMSDAAYEALNPQALVFRTYTNSKGESVVLTIVYHENQRWGAHDVRVCYTSQGWKLIKENGIGVHKVSLKEPGITVNKIEVEKPQARQTVVYWWFTQGKRQMVNRLDQLLQNVTSSILHGYCASGLVRISTNGGEPALDTLNNFVDQLMPVLDNYLP